MFDKYQEQLKIATSLLRSGDKHKYYERVCKLARKYELLITGEDVGELLKRYVPREDENAFQQRVNLTSSITPAVSNTLIQPFQRVSRTDKVKKQFDYKNKAKN